MSDLAERLLRVLLVLGFGSLLFAMVPLPGLFDPPRWLLVSATSLGFALLALTLASIKDGD